MALVLGSCSRENVSDGEEQRIRFTVPGLFQAIVDTKAAEVTSLSQFHVGCVKGTLGVSEQEVWNTTFTSSGGETPIYVSDKYWPISDEGYKFFASNVPLTPSATGYTVSATNATDVVCAVLADPDYCATNVLSFEHIFSRLGNVTLVAFPGYTISGVSITLTPKTGGTYNLRTKSWSGITTGSATGIANSTPGTKANDLYTVPGIYTLTASWTATDSGSNTVTYTNRTVDVELEKGVVNNATITLGGNITVGFALEEYLLNDKLQGVEPLTFEALGNGNILWKTSNAAWQKTIEYSKDGVNWTSITSTTSGAAIPVSTGEKVYIRGNNTAYGSSSYYCYFSGNVNYYVYGNMKDLLAPGHKNQLEEYCFKNLFFTNTYVRSHASKKIYLPSILMGPYCYYQMFYGCKNITIPPEIDALILSDYCFAGMFYNCSSLTASPAITAIALAEYCYESMFQGCKSIRTPPELPLTSLARGCYCGMFQECTGLTTAPELPATTLARACYGSMFYGCTGLTTAPELPSTELAEQCYQYMFYGCSNLTTAPELPATTLATYCYQYMFYGCSRLTTAPVLPAKTLVSNCYYAMFYLCSSLNYIKALFTTTPSNAYTTFWVSKVAAKGTFVKADDATWDVTGTNGVPAGWTVYTESQ